MIRNGCNKSLNNKIKKVKNQIPDTQKENLLHKMFKLFYLNHFSSLFYLNCYIVAKLVVSLKILTFQYE